MSLFLLACLLLVMTPRPALADDLGLDRLEHYTSRDGLSQDWIIHLYQDHQGFLWISTDDGLNRFDGFRFKVYRHDPRDPRSLSDSFVTCAYQDRHGDLWVGTRKGLNRLDASRDDFTRFPHREELPDSLSDGFVTSIAEDANGALWVATMNGANRFNRASGTFQRFHHNPENPGSLSHDVVMRLYRGGGGDLWLGTGDGTLHQLGGDRESFTRYSWLDQGGAVSGEIWAIAEEAGGRLWLGTGGGDLVGLDPATGRRTLHRLSASGIAWIYAVLPRPDGTLWLGSESHGLLVFEPATGAYSAYPHDPDEPGSPGHNRINHMLEDRSGVIWLATDAGLDKLDPSRLRFAYYRHRGQEAVSLTDDTVHSVLEDSRGDLWVGTASGLDRLDRERAAATHYRLDLDDPEGMHRQTVLSMVEDSRGNVWFGTHRGISRFDRDEERFVHLDPDPDDPDSLIEGWVYDLVEGEPGVLWIGGEAGLNRFFTHEQRLRRYRHDPEREDGLAAGLVYDLHYDRRGGLWIGMGGSGLSLLGGAGKLAEDAPLLGGLRHFRHDPNDPSSLSSDTVGAIHEDQAGTLWIGTLGGGLNRLDLEALAAGGRMRFRHYRESDGLANDNILAILEDDRGDLWLSSHRGLTRFDPRTGECRSYDHTDGLQSNAFSFRAAGRTAAGELLFGGPFGLNAFFSDRLPDDPNAPQVAITEFRLFGRGVPFAERIPDSQSGPRPADPWLTLSYRDRIFGFEFAALHFAKPAKNRYKYRLEGFSDEWLESDAGNRFAQYTDLDAGDYRFEVQAANPDGVWSEEVASVRITVLPPPWKTSWAYALYTLALAAVVVGFVRSQQKKVERERTVSRRLREVDRLKDEFLANTSHELRTPLYGIVGIAESLIDGAAGPVAESMRSNLGMIASSGKRLSGLVNDILDFSKMSRKGLELRKKPVDLKALADVVLTLSRPLLVGKDLRLSNAITLDLPAAEADENRLQQILLNLVSNAIKFTDSGRVEVSAVAEEGRLIVTVSDTGIGIAEDRQDHIFESFEQADASTEREFGGTGLGLAVTKELVSLHGGSLWVESSPGEGSRFYFTLPISELAPDLTSLAEPTSSAEPLRRLQVDASIVDEIPPEVSDLEASSSQGIYRILIVDDEPVIRQVLANHLAASEFRSRQAPNGEAALRLVEEEPFDLILLDVMMPRMSGYEVCRRIRAEHSSQDLPILFLTAKDQVADLLAGFEAGANDFLTKPISKSELLARVKTHLDLLHVHRNLEGLVEQKMAQVKVLEGILPICAGCKRIRDDEGDWDALEVYIDRHSEASFSHGLCPNCLEAYHAKHPELGRPKPS